MTTLWANDNVKPRLPYSINQYIREYDISKANINVLYHEGVISKDLYDTLYVADRTYREIYVGLMERDNPEISVIKAEGIKKFRKLFCEYNGLEDNDILSIKNDAIFVLNKQCQYCTFDNIAFVNKNVYTLFMQLQRLELYYIYDAINGNECIDVKGINDNKLEYHRNHMITFLCDIFYKVQNGGTDEAAKTCSQFLENYLRRELDVGFYREFNDMCMFRCDTIVSSFYLEYADQSLLYEMFNLSGSPQYVLNTDVNFNLLRDLCQILFTIKNR